MYEGNVDTPITALGEHNLLEIFQYLDGEMLKTCSLVCKEWDIIIGTSSKTMSKLPLTIRNFRRRSYFSEEKTEIEILDLRRRFRTIIVNNSEIDEQLANVLKKFAFNIRVLKIEDSTVPRELFAAILNSTQKLDHLYIIRSTIRKEEIEGERTLCSLASIKSLTIDNIAFEFVNLFKNTQVHDLEIESEWYIEKLNKIPFKQFMKNQKTLNSLAVSVQDSNFVIDLDLFTRKNRPMNLSRLAVDYNGFGSENWYGSAAQNAMVNLLEGNLSLQSLELTREVPEKILQFVVQKLKISTFIIDAFQLPDQPEFYDQMNHNNYLKTLVLREFANLVAAKGLLRVYPSIEKLVIENVNQHEKFYMNRMLIFISANCLNLKSLAIDQLEHDIPAVTIPSLKTFSIQFVVGNELQTFCLNNPSIENLILNETAERAAPLTYEVINTITTRLTNLKYLRFGECFKPTTRICEMIAQNCRNLQLLEIIDDEIVSPTFAGALNFRIQYYRRDSEIRQLHIKSEPYIWDYERDNFESEMTEMDDEILDEQVLDYYAECGFNEDNNSNYNDSTDEDDSEDQQ